MKFYFVSCFVFGLLCALCYGHKINEIHKNKNVKHISTKIYNPSKKMFSKYLSMNPPRFPPTFIHTRVRVPFNGKVKKINWNPPTFIVRTNKIGELINQQKHRPKSNLQLKKPQDSKTTRQRHSQGIGVPGRNPVIRKIIQKRKKLIPINIPVLRQIIPPNIENNVQKINTLPKRIPRYQTTTIEPQNPISVDLPKTGDIYIPPVDLPKTGDIYIPPKYPILIGKPPLFVSKVGFPTSKPSTFVPVPILNEMNIHTTTPVLKPSTKRQLFMDRITPNRPIPITSKYNIPVKTTPGPNLIWKIPTARPRIQRTTDLPPSPRIFTRQPTIKQRHFSPIVFIRPKTRNKPTTLLPRKPTIKTTLPPILIPPIRSAFEEVLKPPSLIDRGVKKVAILKTSPKNPSEKLVSQMHSIVTTYRPLTSSVNNISTRGLTSFSSKIADKAKSTIFPITTAKTLSTTQPTLEKTTTQIVSNSTLQSVPKFKTVSPPMIFSTQPSDRPAMPVIKEITTLPFVIKTDSTLPINAVVKNGGETTTSKPLVRTTTLPTIHVQTFESKTRPTLRSTARPIVKSTTDQGNKFQVSSTSTTGIPHTTSTQSLPINSEVTSVFNINTKPSMKVTTEGSGYSLFTIPIQIPTVGTATSTSLGAEIASTGNSDIQPSEPSVSQIFTVTPETKQLEKTSSNARGDTIYTTTEQFQIEHRVRVTGIPLSLDMIREITAQSTPETKTIQGVLVHVPKTTPENGYDYVRYRIGIPDDRTTTPKTLVSTTVTTTTVPKTTSPTTAVPTTTSTTTVSTTTTPTTTTTVPTTTTTIPTTTTPTTTVATTTTPTTTTTVPTTTSTTTVPTTTTPTTTTTLPTTTSTTTVPTTTTTTTVPTTTTTTTTTVPTTTSSTTTTTVPTTTSTTTVPTTTTSTTTTTVPTTTSTTTVPTTTTSTTTTTVPTITTSTTTTTVPTTTASTTTTTVPTTTASTTTTTVPMTTTPTTTVPTTITPTTTVPSTTTPTTTVPSTTTTTTTDPTTSTTTTESTTPTTTVPTTTTTTKPTTTTTDPSTTKSTITTTYPTTTTSATIAPTTIMTKITETDTSTSTTTISTSTTAVPSTTSSTTTEKMFFPVLRSTTMGYESFGITYSPTYSTEPFVKSNDTEKNVETTTSESNATTVNTVSIKTSTIATTGDVNQDGSTTTNANNIENTDSTIEEGTSRVFTTFQSTTSDIKTKTTDSPFAKGCVSMGCPRGRQCVTKDNSICSLQYGREDCFCKPGCALENMYVGLGQPIVTDRCGNLCYCGTSGLTACTKIPCNRNKYATTTPSPFKAVEFKPDVKDRGPTRGDSPYFYYDNSKSKSVRVHGLHFPEQLVAWLSPFSSEFRDRLPMTGIKEIPIGSLFKT